MVLKVENYIYLIPKIILFQLFSFVRNDNSNMDWIMYRHHCPGQIPLPNSKILIPSLFSATECVNFKMRLVDLP